MTIVESTSSRTREGAPAVRGRDRSVFSGGSATAAHGGRDPAQQHPVVARPGPRTPAGRGAATEMGRRGSRRGNAPGGACAATTELRVALHAELSAERA